MTTYLIYPDVNDGYIASSNSSYSSTVAGSGLTVTTTDTVTKTGMNKNGIGTYFAYEGFWSFDTSVIPDTDEIVDATLSTYVGYRDNQTVWWDAEFRSFNWTAPLTTSQWKSPATLKTYPRVAAFEFMSANSTYRTQLTGEDALIGSISKTAPTKFISCTSRMVAGNVPTGTEEMWFNSANAASNKPFLTVYTIAPNTLNGVTEASTTLPDGTTISVRSNGVVPSATLTLGYTPLNGSWTSIGTLGSEFANTIDGPGALNVTNDDAGNFYVFGLKSGTTGTIVGKAYKKLTATTWQAMNSLYQNLAIGNESTVRSLNATYVRAGTNSKDLPEIWLLAVRGSHGNSSNYQYHTPGAGFVQDSHVLPNVLLAGTGNMFKKTSAAYSPFGASGVPAMCDVVALDNSTLAVYVARGKFGATTVGGIATIKIVNQDGIPKAKDDKYVATGSAQLVPINSNLFAHVFDNNSTKLSVRFYNASCQIVGETSLAKENFYGSQIGNQFAAVYDKTSNMVRVFYVDVALSTTLSRWDVSPVTFTGTVATAAHTLVGPVSSINTDLRISRTTDERRILIETANNSAGALTTVSTFSTIGNIAPMAPALTTRPNFDATSPATFTFKSGDSNPADYQTAYQIEISRVSDSVVVYDSGKVTSSASNPVVAANTLANGVDYRWRVRTYDVIGTAGTWSVYGTFSTSATGTLTITSPSADNMSPMETDDYTVTWTYVQSGGATQAQRRVRVIRTSDSAVIKDTTMQANTTPSYYISGMESGKEYRVEVSLVNSASISVPVVSRLITPNYSEPMTPQLDITIQDSYVELTVTNPVPTGDRPEVIYNDIYKRRSTTNAEDADYQRVAIISNSATYRDYNIKSGAQYDYYVVGRTV